MGDYPETNPNFPDPHRPNLQPVDPRKTASQPAGATIIGSIDNQSTFDISSGKSTPWCD